MPSACRPAECFNCGVVFSLLTRKSRLQYASEILCTSCRIADRDRTCLECGSTFRAAGTVIRCLDCRKKVVRNCRECGEKTLAGNRALCLSCESIKSAATRHHISVSKYRKLIKMQKGMCAICNQPETRVSKKYGTLWLLSIDHDHSCCSGETSCGECIRGLICSSCNIGLGGFRDNLDFMASAMTYLMQYSSTQTGQPSGHLRDGAQAGEGESLHADFNAQIDPTLKG